MSWKVRITLAIALLLVLAICWVNYPPSRYASQVDASITQRKKEFNQRISQFGNNYEANSFIDPAFGSLWSPGTAATNATIDEFDRHHPATNGLSFHELDKHVLGLPSTPAKLKAARKAFQQMLPDLMTTLEKPVFINPDPTISFFRRSPGFLGLRRLLRSCALEAYLLCLEGKGNESTQLMASACQFICAYRDGEVNVMGLMISNLLRFAILEPIWTKEWFLAKVDDETMTKLEKALLDGPLSEDARYVEEELLFFHSTMDLGPRALAQHNNNALIPRLGWGLLYTTGVLDREVRLYDNDIFPVIEDFRAVRPVSTTAMVTDSPLLDDLRGKHGYLALEAFPHFSKIQGTMMQSRAFQRLARIQCALKRYHNRYGSLPPQLSELEKVGFKIPQSPFSSSPIRLVQSDGVRELVVPVDPGWDVSQLPNNPLKKQPDGLHLTLPDLRQKTTKPK